MELGVRRWLFDTRPIIVDIGTGYCKVGITGEAAPTSVVATSLPTFSRVRESRKLGAGTLKQLHAFTSSLVKEVEELVYDVLFNCLQINPKEKAVILCYNLMTPFSLVRAFTSVLFNTYNVAEIFYFLNNALPIYISTDNSALIVDCGFYCTQVLGIVKGELAKATFKVANVGGFHAKNVAEEVLREENAKLNFTSRILEDTIARYGIVLTKEQKKEFFKTDQIEKMKAKKYHIEIQGASFVMSHYARVSCGEVLFGDVEEEEENVAYTALKAVLSAPISARVNLATKIILAGGACMLPGFKRRFLQEMRELLIECSDFKEIACTSSIHIRAKGLCSGSAEYISTQHPAMGRCFHTRQHKENGENVGEQAGLCKERGRDKGQVLGAA